MSTRLQRLYLDAFGAFEGREIDLGDDGPGLTLVIGPNEAGKSTVLRAISALYFGFPERTTDNFRHAYERLRVGARVLVDGQPVELTRLKKRSGSLVGRDDGVPVPAALETRLTAGLSSNDYLTQYAIDHAGLRDGAQALLAGHGEIGAALFQASAGAVDLNRVVRAIDEQARALFAPRARHGRINAALRQRRELDEQWRRESVRPDEWEARQRLLAAAQSRRQSLAERRAALSRELQDLQLLLRAGPELRGMAQARAQLETLGPVPALRPDARAIRIRTEAAREQQQAVLDELDVRIASLERAASAASGDRALLDQRRHIERFVHEVDSAPARAAQLAAAQARLVEVDDDVVHRLATLHLPVQGHSPPDLASLRDALPAAHERRLWKQRVDAMADAEREWNAQRSLLDQNDGHAEHESADAPSNREGSIRPGASDAAAIDGTAMDASIADAPYPAPRLRDAVRAASDTLHSLQPRHTRLTELDVQLSALDEALAHGRRELAWDGLDTLELDDVQPMIDQSIEARDRLLANHDATVKLAREQTAQAERAVVQSTAQIERLRAKGEIVTTERLAAARERRDAAWGDLLLEPGRIDVPRARQFEKLVHEADRLADAHAAQADRLAQWALAQSEQQRLQRDLEQVRQNLADAEEAQRQALAQWHEQLAQRGLRPLEPRALLAWQARWNDWNRQRQQRDQAATERRLLSDQYRQAIDALATALQQAGTGPADRVNPVADREPAAMARADAGAQDARTDAATLAREARTQMLEADRRMTFWSRIEQARMARDAAEQARRQQQRQAERALQRAARDLADARDALGPMMRQMGFDPTADAAEAPTLDDLRSRLQAWDALDAALTGRDALRREHAEALAALDGMARHAADIAAQMRRAFATQARPDPQAVAAVDVLRPDIDHATRAAGPDAAPAARVARLTRFAEHIERLLTAAVAAAQEHAQATRTLDETRRQRTELARQLAQHDTTLRQLRTEAGLDEACGPADLAAIEERVELHARLTRQARMHLDHLAQWTTETPAQLSARLGDRDEAALQADVVRLTDDRQALDVEIEQAVTEVNAAQARLDAIDSSDQAIATREALEREDATVRAGMEPWLRLRVAHALLDEAVRRFRDRAQGPMLDSASHWFAQMTGGEFERLVSDGGDGEPVLLAQRRGRNAAVKARAQSEAASAAPSTSDTLQAPERLRIETLSEGTRDQLYLALRLAAARQRERPDEPPMVLDDVLMTSDDQRAGWILQALADFAQHRQVIVLCHHAHMAAVARQAVPDAHIKIVMFDGASIGGAGVGGAGVGGAGVGGASIDETTIGSTEAAPPPDARPAAPSVAAPDERPARRRPRSRPADSTRPIDAPVRRPLRPEQQLSIPIEDPS